MVQDATQEELERLKEKEEMALNALSHDFYPIHVKMRMIEAE